MSSWDSNTIKINIPKQNVNSNRVDFELGEMYNIIVDDYILNPPPTFTLAANWNFNTIQPEKELHVQVLQTLGNMIKFKCKGKNTNIEWEGWLPRKSFKVI